MTRAGELKSYSLYGETPAPIAPEFVHIEPVSTRSALYGWTIAPHDHPHIHQLLLVERGSGVLTTDGTEVELAPVTLIVLPSRCVHAFRFDAVSEGWVLSLASALLHDPRLAASETTSLFGGGARFSRLSPGSRAARSLSWQLADLAGDLEKPLSGRLPNRLTALLGLVLATAEDVLGTGSDAPPAGDRDDLAVRFHRLADGHFRDGWSVKAYAEMLGTTEPTLTRACRAALGKAPGQVVLDRVLLEAMRYLTYSGASVSQISNNLGFSDPAYFARFFKKRTGMTATAFRREGGWFDQR